MPDSAAPASQPITVRVLLFAALRQQAGQEQLLLELPAGSTVQDAAARLAQQGLAVSGCMVAVNDAYAAPDTALQGGDELAILPPVSGG